jgi:MFS family permease
VPARPPLGSELNQLHDVVVIAATGLNAAVMVELITLTVIPPYVPLFLLGISYGIAASSLWPLVPLVVPQDSLSLAFGLIFSIQNAGLVVAPLAIGFASRDGAFGYATSSFALCAAASCLFAVSLLVVDLIQGRRLNISARALRDHEQLVALAHEEYELPQEQEYSLTRSDSLSLVDIRQKRNSRCSYY